MGFRFLSNQWKDPVSLMHQDLSMSYTQNLTLVGLRGFCNHQSCRLMIFRFLCQGALISAVTWLTRTMKARSVSSLWRLGRCVTGCKHRLTPSFSGEKVQRPPFVFSGPRAAFLTVGCSGRSARGRQTRKATSICQARES